VFIAFLDANPTRYKNTPEVDGYNSTQDILNELADRKLIANPDPQGDVPGPLTIGDLQLLLSPESLGKLSDSWWDIMRAYIAESNGSRSDAVDMVNVALSRGNITQDEATDLINAINAVIPDPSWPSEVQDNSDLRTEWDLGGMNSAFVNNSLGRV
jgi:hypothetical protein